MTDVAKPPPTAVAQDVPQRVAIAVDDAKAFLTGFSVRTKILGIVVTLTMVLGLGITLQVRSVMTSVLITELDNRGASVASDLAARATDPLLLDDPYTVFETLSESIDHHPDTDYAYVINAAGSVLVHSFGDEGFPSELLAMEPGSSEDAVVHRHFTAAGSTYHEFEAPILDGELGSVRVGLTEDRLSGLVNGITTQMLITTLFVALIGVAAASFLTWLLTRPIVDLVDTTRRVGEGDLTARAPYYADDEIGSLSQAFNQMVNDLEENRATILETEAARTRLLEKLISAQEEERKRIARELHDTVGQSLSSIMVGIAVLGRLSGDAADDKSQEIQQLAGETLTQVRDLSRELRPSALDDLGLSAALERYAEDYTLRHPGMTTDVHAELPGRLAPTLETALYRIVQEAMTNAARHGDADTVSILIVRREGMVRAIIEDDGRGFDLEAVRRRGMSVGIHAMQERAELLSGSLEIESGPGGTTVYVEVPV